MAGAARKVVHVAPSDARVKQIDAAGIKAVSRRMVTRAESERLGLYHATMEAPLDYTTPGGDQDVVFYQLAGTATVSADGEDHVLRPGDALLIPSGVKIRHTAKEPTTTLIVWGPSPATDEHHQNQSHSR